MCETRIPVQVPFYEQLVTAIRDELAEDGSGIAADVRIINRIWPMIFDWAREASSVRTELIEWACEMNPPDYTRIERTDPLWEKHSPGLMRGYNIARHLVADLLTGEGKGGR